MIDKTNTEKHQCKSIDLANHRVAIRAILNIIKSEKTKKKH